MKNKLIYYILYIKLRLKKFDKKFSRAIANEIIKQKFTK
jgi:hypothetical protein